MLKSCLLLLQCEIESNKQNAARQSALVQSLRERIREAEDSAAEKENFANRSDITITSLKKEMQNQQDRLQQVESSLKHHISAEEEASSRAAKWESKVQLYKMYKLCESYSFYSHFYSQLSLNWYLGKTSPRVGPQWQTQTFR